MRRWSDHFVGALLALVFVAALSATADDLGMSRDESFYVSAAESYASWFEILVDDPARALDDETIYRHWKVNWEHPALMKSAFALSWIAQQRYGIFENDSLAFRFPAMLCAGFLIWLVYVWGAYVIGRPGALFAALALATMPRFFYHAHLNCFDVPIAFFTTLCAYAYWRSLTERSWAWVLGLLYGLALATKHNAWVLPGIFIIHYIWWRRQHAPDKPWWLLAMFTLGPLVFIASWPWLWHDGWSRFVAYASFHLNHAYYNIAYFGTTYFRPPFPVAYPFVMTLFTVSTTTLALALLGLGSRSSSLWRSLFGRRSECDVQNTDVLWVGLLLAPLVMIAVPSTPIFGGTKHWMTAYPFIALYAGAAMTKMLEAWVSPSGLMRSTKAVVSIASGALLLAPGAIDTTHSHPFALSHYTAIAGGTPGAATLGMNRQYWGFTTGSLAEWLGDALPRGGRIWLCDTTMLAWDMLKRDGKVPRDIRATSHLPSADLALVHHEHHFDEVDHQIWMAFGTTQPIKVLTYDGVPIVSVYKNAYRTR